MSEINNTTKRKSKKLSLLIGLLFLSIFIFAANLNISSYKSDCVASASISTQPQSEEYHMIAGAVGVDDYLEGMILDHDENIIIYGEVAGKMGFFRHDTHLKPPLNSSDYAIWERGVIVRICQDSLGNIYLAGHNDTEMFLIKYNVNLELQWNKTWEGWCYDMIIDSNDNIFLAGDSMAHYVYRGWAILMKLDTNGNELWIRYSWSAYVSWYSTNDFEVLVKDSNDNIYFAYQQYEFNIEGYISGPIYRILKFSNSGTLLLNFSYIPSNYQDNVLDLRMLAIDSSDNLYVLGRRLNNPESTHIVKYNNMGLQEWNQTYDFYGNIVYLYMTMKFDSSGYLYLLEPGDHIALVKINPSSGNTIWQTPHNTINECGFSLEFDSNNNIYVVGRIEGSTTGERDVLITKYDSDGIFIGKKIWDHNGNESGYEIVINSQDEIFIAGTADSFFSSDYDLFLLKINPIFGSDPPIVIIIIVSIITTGAVVGLVIFFLWRRKIRRINRGD